MTRHVFFSTPYCAIRRMIGGVCSPGSDLLSMSSFSSSGSRSRPCPTVAPPLRPHPPPAATATPHCRAAPPCHATPLTTSIARKLTGVPRRRRRPRQTGTLTSTPDYVAIALINPLPDEAATPPQPPHTARPAHGLHHRRGHGPTFSLNTGTSSDSSQQREEEEGIVG
jgi:hypothetical protein